MACVFALECFLQIEKLESRKLFVNFFGLAIQWNSFTVQTVSSLNIEQL